MKILIDDEDRDLLNSCKWYINKARNSFYAQNSKGLRLHRQIAMKMFGGFAVTTSQVDHRNGNGLDNRRSNLRLCSIAQNSRNSRSRKGSTSRYLGVSKIKGKQKWYSRIQTNGKTICLGSFNTEKEAALAYNNAARIYHDEFANLNKVGR